MTPPLPSALHAAALRLLQPATRWYTPPPGSSAKPVQRNAIGIDVYDQHVPAVRLDADGLAHAYLALWPGAGTSQRTRITAPATARDWTLLATLAAGDPERVQWALDRLLPLLDEHPALLDAEGRELTGPLRPTLTDLPITEDDTVQPARWSTSLRYAARAY